ncbi:MAG: 50S ribosomal protein L10 [Nitriliruptor sp.]|nr:MAG: 50S ribosomal protein L10 [Nitriliruptor sp.]
MARPEKVAKVEEVRADLSGAAATLLTHYRGLSVTELAELRAKLREANAEMKVVKNTLTKRAAEAAGIEGLDDLLEGPTSLVLCAEDPVGPAKALKAFAKDHPDLTLRGGYLDGEVLDAEEALKLADLESREELLARLAGLMQGALSGTARLLLAATEKQARLLQALVDAGGVEAKGFTPSAPAAAPEAAAPEAAEPEAAAEPEPAPEAEAVPEAAAEPEPAPEAEAVPEEPAAATEDAAEPKAAADTEAASGDEPVADETTTEA